jgi:outer membrane protein insertion porin family
MRLTILYTLFALLVSSTVTTAQVNESIINYSNPKTYKIGGIAVTGTQFLDPNSIINMTGLKKGDEIKVPGEEITLAIKKLWEQDILSDVQFKVTDIVDDQIFFEVVVKERPRLSKYVFFGVKKSEEDDLKEKIKLNKGKIVTDVMLSKTQNKVKAYYVEKGFKNVRVVLQQSRDSSNTLSNTVTLRIIVNKGRKIRVDKVDIEGNREFKDKKLKWKLKNTRNINLYVLRIRSKFVKAKFEEDKKKLTEFYLSKGFRDFEVVSDTVYGSTVNKKFVNVKLKIHEGPKYYFRNIEWTGNYKYDSRYLSQVLGIKKGDVYNLALLEKRLNYNPTGADVSSLYMDDGYLFYNVETIEKTIDNDSIDIEMRMYEGPQATINKISIAGNTKTNDHVVLREIRTRPGQKFSRADLIRTQREISTLGFFDPEQIGITPKPNPATGTVDIDYTLVEKPSDQIELSGGWGGFYGFIGTLGVTFNNFSARNLFNLKKWSPLPAGDGQKMSARIQANGPAFQSYSISFAEPWLGGRKPTSLSVSASYSINRLGMGFGLGGGGFGFGGSRFSQIGGALNRGELRIFNTAVSLGRRIRWPDDYFTLSNTLSYSHYTINNYDFFPQYPNGISHNLVLTNALARNSVDNPIYPRSGSSLSLSLAMTPPYSFINPENYGEGSDPKNQYKFAEYYKVMFDGAFYMPVVEKLVFATKAHFGFMGRYNPLLDYSPFERFWMGGNGLFGFNFILGVDPVGLRGYANNSIGPSPRALDPNNRSSGGVVFNKFVFELRYPISLSQMATVYVLSFAEGGNNFGSYDQYNPLSLKKSVGLGARIFMPAFGIIGLDYGYALDRESGEAFQPFVFTIGQQIR